MANTKTFSSQDVLFTGLWDKINHKQIKYKKAMKGQRHCYFLQLQCIDAY